MINRDSWGHSYLTARGEILGFVKDELLRKHLPSVCEILGFVKDGLLRKHLPRMFH